jgi:hypothetical protein
MDDRDLDAAVADGFAADPTTNRSIRLLNDLKRRTASKLHLVIWEPPPLPGEPARPTNRQLGTPQVELMAGFLVAVLAHLRDRGLTPDAVELANEPDGTWNMRIRPRDYVRLVEAVRKRARDRDLRLPQIYGPGTSTIAALEPFLADAALARRLLAAVDVLSLHAWDDPRRRGPHAGLDAIFRRLAGLGVRREIAITEYAIARPRPSDPSPQAYLKMRVPGTLADTNFFAAVTARDLLRLYGRGVGTVIYWEYQDPPWGRASFGLLDPKGMRRPVYEVLRPIARSLRASGPQLRSTTDGSVTIMDSADGRRLWVTNPEATPASLRPPLSAAVLPSVMRCGDGADGPAIVVPPETVLSLDLNGAEARTVGEAPAGDPAASRETLSASPLP